MVIRLRNLIRNNNVSKIAALILGYLLWFSLAQHSISTRRLEIPLCFYDTHDTLIKQAPEEISVVLRAPRAVLATLDNHIAAHVDASKLVSGPQNIELSEENLLLPSIIRLQDIVPTIITIVAQKL